ncbi:MAG: MFS transporter [bacterium]|nr:MFS transporter [bacterium]
MIAVYRDALRSTSRDVRLFLVAVGVAGFSYMGMFLLLANLYLLRLDFDETFIGMFAATGALSAAIFGLPAGIVGQRLGARRSMIFGFALLALGIGLLSVAALLPRSWQAVWLLSCCVVRELGNSLYNVNSNPYLMTATPVEQRGSIFALRNALANLAGFAGSSIGGFLPMVWVMAGGHSAADPRAYMAPLLLAAFGLIPGVLALLATGPLLESNESMPAVTRLSEPLRDRILTAAAHQERRKPAPQKTPPPLATGPAGGAVPWAPLIILPVVGVLYITSVAASIGFFNVLMDRVFSLSTARIGGLMAATQLLCVPVILLMTAQARRFGTGPIVSLAAVLVAVGAVLQGNATHWMVAGAGFILMGGLNGVFFSSITVYHQEVVHPDWRPLMSGAFLTSCALGWALTNSVGGYVIITWGYAPLFSIAAVATLAGALVFSLFARSAAASP